MKDSTKKYAIWAALTVVIAAMTTIVALKAGVAVAIPFPPPPDMAAESRDIGFPIDNAQIKQLAVSGPALFNAAVTPVVIKQANTPVASFGSSGQAVAAPLSVQAAGTPVMAVGTTGKVTANYGAAGQQILCGQSTVTGTLAITSSVTGIATPQYVMHGLAQDVTGNGARTGAVNAGGVITLSVWTAAATPAAATTAVPVSWCVVGKP